MSTAGNDRLPISAAPSGHCSRCNVRSSFEVSSRVPITSVDGKPVDSNSSAGLHKEFISVLVCRNCRQGLIAVEELLVNGRPYSLKDLPAGNVRFSWRGIHWWPSREESVSPDLPGQIASAFLEAVKSFHAGCYRASVVMARRTVEAIAADKGETDGILKDRLKRLASTQRIDPSLEKWSHEVRLIGNVGAHFDPIEDVSEEDADDMIGFVRELLRFLYEIPAEVARRRAKHRSKARERNDVVC